MVDGCLAQAGRNAVDHIKRYPGFKPRTGAVQRGTKTRVVRLGGGRLLRITNDHPAAPTLDGGSRPHIIRARTGKALKFTMGGKVMFRRSVRHPGTRPYKTFYR